MISVVIPSHNRPGSVVGALRSLARQTVAPLEAIVVDDGSDPALGERELAAAAGGVPLVLLRHDEPRGGNAARNAGIARAAGDYVAFLDDDDEFEPPKIECLHRAARAHPRADVIHHPARIVMVRQAVEYVSTPKDLWDSSDAYHELIIGNWVGGTSMVTVRRSVLDAVGRFDEALPSMQDYDLWIRLAAYGARFLRLDQPLTRYTYDTTGTAVSLNLAKHFAADEALRAKHRAGYAGLSPAERKQHEVWSLNVATHRALLAGDTKTARGLQRRAVALLPRPATVANAVVASLGPAAAFRLRSVLSRGPTAARDPD